MTVIREVRKVLEMSVSFMERCNGNVGGVKGCAGVTAISTLRDDLTFIYELRKYDIFS